MHRIGESMKLPTSVSSNQMRWWSVNSLNIVIFFLPGNFSVGTEQYRENVGVVDSIATFDNSSNPDEDDDEDREEGSGMDCLLGRVILDNALSNDSNVSFDRTEVIVYTI
jgi:hypothetical protein